MTIHQPLYLGGYLGTIDKIRKADIFVILDTAQFSASDYIQRNKIRTKEGTCLLTVPIKHSDGFQAIKDVGISNTNVWQKKHLKSIVQNYRKAKCFETYHNMLEEIYTAIVWHKLSQLDEFIMRWIISEFGIDVKIIRASDYDFKGKKSDLILDICQKLGASTYISGMFGKDYLKEKDFVKSGIAVVYQDRIDTVYRQVYNKYFPCSTLDLLLNYGKSALQVFGDN